MSTRDGRTLYRIPKQGKIAGVCAGVADYFGFETWLVRVVAVSIFLLGGSGIIFILYVALWMILDVKPVSTKVHDDISDIEVKRKVWQAGEPAKQALADVNRQFRSLESRLQSLERYVTSDNYDLKRQINNL
ncbi:envelope stress response membrane protein PspC [Shewanella litorisediminis]|uniref:Envelope stress response membrane protein PspC n=1 Tax=Shewanella litorisediminis TaxID=1173586 RepID=A0ABX7G710_9GAMM|nr:envelope stress response membrane protein PspC [Shewanella litorisediminis]MCL2916857.1 envelope stress response membrane protein PspC [Shewanella litorisediminis]QRH02975.1 envelope stress response membrane protein PspC [Shewanella litorisediminis]